MTGNSKAGLMALQSAVLLFGLAGLFGKWSSLSPLGIVVGRTFFAALSLGMLLLISGRRQTIRSPKELMRLIVLGVILAVHWWAFFHAIQISTVAVGLLGYAAFPVFVTFLEPYFFNERLRAWDVVTAVAVMIGLTAVAWPIELNASRTLGVFWGVVSGLLFAVLAVLNRRYVQRHSPLVIACFQNAFACLTLLPAVILSPWQLTWIDIGQLALLGIVCTALSHALFIYSLTMVRAQLAGIVAALEPVYGIIFAFLLLGEIPQTLTLAGGVLILGTTCVAMLRRPSTT